MKASILPIGLERLATLETLPGWRSTEAGGSSAGCSAGKRTVLIRAFLLKDD